MPIHSEVKGALKAKLEIDAYGNDRSALIADLKLDSSLYLFVLKRLVEYTQESSAGNGSINPTQLLKTVPQKEIARAIEDSSGITPFEDAPIHLAQAYWTKYILLSSSASAVLARNHGVEPEEAYAASLMRHLGYTLIAWNYPGIFKSTLAKVAHWDEIESELSMALGFSPALLAVYIARSWNLSEEFLVAVGDESLLEEEQVENNPACDALKKVCLLGHTLASCLNKQVELPQLEDFEAVRLQIERTIGQSGLQKILDSAAQRCRHYHKSLPGLFSIEPGDMPPLPESDYHEALIRNNRYLDFCSTLLRERLTQLYRRIDGRSITRDNIHFIVNQVIPVSGFKSGCIFLVDPESNQLVPRLPVGSVNKQIFQSVSLYPDSAFHPIKAAFHSRSVIHEVGQQIANSQVSYVAGTLGSVQKTGVLYLEIDDNIEDNTSRNPQIMNAFKAIQAALIDCLNLY